MMHTPGPWCKSGPVKRTKKGEAPFGYINLDAPGHLGGLLVEAHYSMPDGEHAANLHLIGTAPEMLAALKGCAEALNLASQSFRIHNPMATVPNLYDLHVEAAKAVITKAEGGEPKED